MCGLGSNLTDYSTCWKCGTYVVGFSFGPPRAATSATTMARVRAAVAATLLAYAAEGLAWPAAAPPRLQRTKATSNAAMSMSMSDHWPEGAGNVDRRTALRLPLLPLALSSAVSSMAPTSAAARGLVQLPLVAPLSNTYVLLRAGESLFEEKDEVRTNPVNKLSVDDGLTTRGKTQAEEAAATLTEMGIEDPIIWYSTWAKASQTAEIVADRLIVGRDRRQPEYNFLDARGLGLFEGTSLSYAEKMVATMDELDANDKPPLAQASIGIDGGTPNKSVADMLGQIRQMISIIETSAESVGVVVVVAPDSYALSVWQAAVAGVPLEGHEAFRMAPGELRVVEYEVAGRYGEPGVVAGKLAGSGGAPTDQLSDEFKGRQKEAAALTERGRAAKGTASSAARQKEREALERSLTAARENAEIKDRAALQVSEASRRRPVVHRPPWGRVGWVGWLRRPHRPWRRTTNRAHTRLHPSTPTAPPHRATPKSCWRSGRSGRKSCGAKTTR